MINKIVHSPAAALQKKNQLPNQIPDRSPSLSTPQEAILTSGSKFTLVTTANGLVKESLYLNRDDWWKSELDKTDKFQRISDPILVAGNPGYQNYYHWTYQIWSAILFAQSQSKDSDNLNVLGPPLNSWRRRYIELLGDQIHYIESATNCAYFLDAAQWSDVMHGSYAFSPSSKILQLLEGFGSRFVQKTPSRIYISRKDTPRRGVANEDEVERAVARRGFTPILLSQLPLTDQISLLRGAEYIIAPHGAGLTNIVFSGQKRKLIELMPDDYCNQCFRAIATGKNFDYIGIINPSTTDTRGYHFSKINVDIQTLNSSIDEMENIQ
jgi:capsular polysaccharide biosynthesis protein